MTVLAMISAICLVLCIGAMRDEARDRLGDDAAVRPGAGAGASGGGPRGGRPRGGGPHAGRPRGAAPPGGRDGVDGVIGAVSARLRSGAGLQEAFEEQAGHRFAASRLTAGRVLTVLDAHAGSESGEARHRAAHGIAWACAVAQDVGCEPTKSLEAVGAEYARGRNAENLRRQALAMPRATVRVLLALPALTLLLGEAMSARPLAFLLGSATGHVVLLAGLSLQGVGVLWVRRVTQRFERCGAGAVPSARGG